jgi:hypothetical protein
MPLEGLQRVNIVRAAQLVRFLVMDFDNYMYIYEILIRQPEVVTENRSLCLVEIDQTTDTCLGCSPTGDFHALVPPDTQ